MEEDPADIEIEERERMWNGITASASLGGCVVAYRYDDGWVAQKAANYTDAMAYPTPEEAIAAWKTEEEEIEIDQKKRMEDAEKLLESVRLLANTNVGLPRIFNRLSL